jgi:Fe2+ or Zn2+ uptake regulation protein
LAPRQLKGTNNQKTLCRYLYEQGDHISSYSLIQQGTGLPFGTIRGILRRLEEYNIIAKETWRGQDCRQGQKWTQKTGPAAKVDISCREEAIHVQKKKNIQRRIQGPGRA